MRFSSAFSGLVSLLSIRLVAGANFPVMVGMGGNTFTPETISNAQNGDTVSFMFVAGNHSVTQSTFPAPCTKMTTPQAGIDSDFQFSNASSGQVPAWSFTVQNASAPLWFYCKQAQHCAKNGMVFSVNPTADKSQAQFKQNAMNSLSNGSASAGASATDTAAGGAATQQQPSGALRAYSSTAGLLAAVGLAIGFLG